MMMELEWMRSVVTVVAFATFVAIVGWAWSAARKNDFERAARSVLEDGEPNSRSGSHE